MSHRIDFNRNWEFVESAADSPTTFADEGKEMRPVILPYT